MGAGAASTSLGSAVRVRRYGGALPPPLPVKTRGGEVHSETMEPNSMRIFWQSFVDQQTSAPYLSYLATYLTRISLPDVTVEVHGLSPTDRDFGRLAELRCAIRAIDNGISRPNARATTHSR